MVSLKLSKEAWDALEKALSSNNWLIHNGRLMLEERRGRHSYVPALEVLQQQQYRQVLPLMGASQTTDVHDPMMGEPPIGTEQRLSLIEANLGAKMESLEALKAKMESLEAKMKSLDKSLKTQIVISGVVNMVLCIAILRVITK